MDTAILIILWLHNAFHAKTHKTDEQFEAMDTAAKFLRAHTVKRDKAIEILKISGNWRE